jgi:hypothetical protein
MTDFLYLEGDEVADSGKDGEGVGGLCGSPLHIHHLTCHQYPVHMR